jgi:hypothetical protein
MTKLKCSKNSFLPKIVFRHLEFGLHLIFACLPVDRDFEIWNFHFGGVYGPKDSSTRCEARIGWP